MSLDVQANIDAIRDLALDTGLFAVINGHEPATPLDSGLTAAVWMQTMGPAPKQSGLNTTAAAVTYMMRIYTAAVTLDLDTIDPAVGAATSAMIGLLSGDFQLGDTVFAVDLLGMRNGTPLAAKAGYANVAGPPTTLYRIMDITIPLIIDAVWTQGADA